MKVLAGCWEAGSLVMLKLNATRSRATHLIPPGFFAKMIPIEDVASIQLMTEENKTSIVGKAAWGAAGAALLGPLGLLAGVLGGGNVNRRVVEITLADGRAALVDCSAEDAKRLMAACYGR